MRRGRQAGRRADRGLAPDPRAPRAGLRGALRPRPADRRSSRTRGSHVDRGAYGLDTAFAARAGSDGPVVAVLCEYDALPGIGHACGHNIIAHRRARRRAGRRGAGRRARRPGASSSARRPRRAAAARCCMAERGAFDGVDAAMMVHPAGADLRTHGRHRRPAAPRRLPRPGRPRRRVPVEGPQRARRRRARLHERRRAAPAHPARRAHPRHLHRRRRQAEHRARRAPRRSGTSGRRTLARLEPLEGARPRRASRPAPTRGRLHDGRTSGRTRPTPTCVDNGPIVRPVRAPTPSALGRDVARSRGATRRRGRQHRHGQRQLPRAVDPPDDQGVAAERVDPHPGVRRATPAARRGRPGRARRGQGHGHDGRRPLAPADVARPTCEPAFAASPADRRRSRTRRSGLAAMRGGRRRRRPYAVAAVTVYVAEEFTPDEADILRRYFTNLDGPVFALVNLPEVVKGALFARYSPLAQEPAPPVPRRVRRRPRHHRRRRDRRHRRPAPGRGALRPGVLRVRRRLRGPARRRAPGLRAGLEPAHQGARVGPAHGLPRAVAPATSPTTPASAAATATTATRRCSASPLGTRYVGDMDRLFDTYAELLPPLQDFFRDAVPQARRRLATSSTARRSGPRRSTRCAASCRRRRCPTSASTAPVRATSSCCCACGPTRCPRPARYADLMLHELRKVIPSFLKRVDLDRSRRGVERLPATTTRRRWTSVAERLFPAADAEPTTRPSVTLIDFDPDAEDKLVAAMLYPYTHLPERQIEARVRAMSVDGARSASMRAYVGEREQPPPQAGPGVRARRLPLRRAGRLRRVPRPAAPPDAHHRVAAAHARATATPGPRWSTTPARRDVFDDAMERSAALLRRCSTTASRQQAPYAVSLAYQVRFVMQFNAREAMHLIELRTGPAGPPGVPTRSPRRCTG